MMLNDTDDATGDDGRVAVPSGSAGRRRWSAAEKTAVVRETLVPGARVSDVARRWQVDAQQVYRWRNRDGVTHGGTMARNDTAEPAFVPIVTDAMPVGEAAPAVLARPVIEIRLAGAVVRVVSGLDDAQLTAVLRAVRASVLRA
jgi:transposase